MAGTSGTSAPTSAVCQLGLAASSFAIDLFKALAKNGGSSDQIFCSPFSVMSASVMTYIGAKGNTAEQMNSVLHLRELKGIDLHKTFHSLNKIITTGSGNSYMMHVANQLFTNDRCNLSQEFITQTWKYETKAQKMNFRGDAEGSRQAINSLVEKQTCQKIQNLLPQGSIGGTTALVIVNAIYFKAEWQDKFKACHTRKAQFFVSAQEKVDVDMMYQSGYFHYTRSAQYKCQALTMPYKNDHLSMVILLPFKESSMADLEGQLSITMLNAIADQGANVKVSCYIPKFKFDDSIEMSQVLSSMGMSDLFQYGKADLSGIDGTRELFASAVFHKAFVEVSNIDEQANLSIKTTNGGRKSGM